MSTQSIYYKTNPDSTNVYELDRIDMTLKMFNVQNGVARLLSSKTLTKDEMMNEAWAVASRNHTFALTDREYCAVMDLLDTL